ncbi:MAG: glycosyltransferase family 4 protein [Candidatus Hodarchaeota archaeon]
MMIRGFKDMDNMSKKRKICFVSGSYPKYKIGGAELQSYYLAREFVKIGWEVHFTCTDLGNKNREFIIDEGIRVHKFNYKRLFDVLSFFKIYNVLKKINADIYYFRGTYFTGITGLYAKIHKKIFILAISSDVNCNNHIFIKSVRKSNMNLFRKIILYLDAKIKDIVYFYGLNNADLVFVQTKYQKNLIKRNFHIESYVLKNGHPIHFRLPPKANPPTVLWVGSLKRLRQAEVFIRLAKKCEDLDCRFILAGRPSDERYRDEVLKQLEGLSNVKYIGGLTLEESNEKIGRASILVNTSKYEGFPNTFVQAWMREVPTVSLNVDPDNIIKDFQLGFHSKTFDQLVKEIRLLITDKNLRIKIGQNARKYAIEEHDINKIHEKFLIILNELH